MKNFPVYFFDYFGMIKAPYITYELRNGVKYRVRSGTTDRGVINEIWVHKDYTPKGFKIKNNDIVLDVGGHIGIFSIFASKMANYGKVYVFEPFPENFDLLNKNIKLNRAYNIKPFNVALSDKTGTKEFFVSETENKGGGSFYERKEKKTRKIKIKTQAFNEFFDKNEIQKIDFLKMDCEGGEYSILLKCYKKNLKKIKKMSIEYHNINKKQNGLILRKFLEKSGYKVLVSPISKRRGMIYAKLS